DPHHPRAAAYATTLARDELEFAKWAALTKANAPESEKNGEFDKIKARIEDWGEPYDEIMIEVMNGHFARGESGLCAALLEVILGMPGGRAAKDVQMCRQRAQALRALDAAAAGAREVRGE